MTANFIPLSQVPAALQAHGATASYSRVWAAVIRGAVPHERIGNRIRINPEDLPALAEAIQPGHAPAGR